MSSSSPAPFSLPLHLQAPSLSQFQFSLLSNSLFFPTGVVISWIRICINLQMPSQNVWNMSLFEHFLKGLSLISSWDLDPDSHPHQGEKSDPDPHQIKIRIRIRLRVISRVRKRIRIRIKVMMRIYNSDYHNQKVICTGACATPTGPPTSGLCTTWRTRVWPCWAGGQASSAPTSRPPPQPP